MIVEIGDYAECERKFDQKDLELFADAIQDKYAAHKQSPTSGQSTFYRSDIVYGIFTSASFTSLFRLYFPKAIYMSQDLKFRKPILRDENVKARVEITGWDAAKKNVQFRTVILKQGESGQEEVAVEGNALLKIPYIEVK
ncbi:hypothetical protein FGO68_gene16333 [Halteria grandinella]|uniref:MaoC-like domain-containing protein n=1 Tax=Halteria grandinella TaxID=5974 RepID=A0A8J8NIN1_HALGN|nr:hypothetical protein FGO68_gene16333 [Halteria grandinella]